MLDKVQSLLDQAFTRREIAEELKIKRDTLRKAINDGRLEELAKKIRTSHEQIRADCY